LLPVARHSDGLCSTQCIEFIRGIPNIERKTLKKRTCLVGVKQDVKLVFKCTPESLVHTWLI
jgi:hypothetical protein